MLRPLSVPRPSSITEPIPAASSGAAGEWLPGVKMADPGLLTRLQAVASHYKGRKITIVSGYRPGSVGSQHRHAKAMDFHVDGLKNEELVTFCRALPDTGCGYYPNSSFVHMDVRPPGTGHVYWIDASGPGETARYVAAWPPQKGGAAVEVPRPDHAAPTDEHTHGRDDPG